MACISLDAPEAERTRPRSTHSWVVEEEVLSGKNPAGVMGGTSKMQYEGAAAIWTGEKDSTHVEVGVKED